MPKRERDLRLHIMITHEELAAIQERMAEVNSQNQSAFIRKMAVDGYAVNVDLAPVKELLSLQRRSVNNLFQIAKYAKSHNAYQFEL
ncbi:plasmid mobilization protein [Faecalispora jeddahensis]|uniref:plasmid mobilization protein n=1 Tax=Faecalispora jeddahensis TaxID=1414721 RepID=UPI001FAC2BF6|nr:plasmid mobilization relaxosome protein MobC [Faecalispora jeddahensis]